MYCALFLMATKKWFWWCSQYSWSSPIAALPCQAEGNASLTYNSNNSFNSLLAKNYTFNTNHRPQCPAIPLRHLRPWATRLGCIEFLHPKRWPAWSAPRWVTSSPSIFSDKHVLGRWLFNVSLTTPTDQQLNARQAFPGNTFVDKTKNNRKLL